MKTESKILRAIRRTLLPYGRWTCADGREVLFNRGYRAVLQRLPGGEITIAAHDAWVPWVKEIWFYADDKGTDKVGLAAAAWADFVGTPFDWDAAALALEQHGDPKLEYVGSLRAMLTTYFEASADA